MNLEDSVVAVDWEMWVWSETVEHTIWFHLHQETVVYKDGFPVPHHSVIYVHIHLLSKCNDNWSVRCELLAISLAAGAWQTLNLHINTDPHRITVRLLFLKIKRTSKGSQLNNTKTCAFRESIHEAANNDLLLLFLSQLFVGFFFVVFFYNASHSAPHTVCSQSPVQRHL